MTNKNILPDTSSPSDPVAAAQALTHLIEDNREALAEGTYGVLDVFGPTLGFLILPEEGDGAYCVMTGTIPPGASVPLHSHPDIERFFPASGTVQVMPQRDGKFK
jgi:quercetin dioxygenase-like cupin family protein